MLSGGSQNIIIEKSTIDCKNYYRDKKYVTMQCSKLGILYFQYS